MFHDEGFRAAFLLSVRAAADFLMGEIGPRDLIVAHPAGVETSGIASWRNIIPGAVIAGEVTELNCLCAMALHHAAEFTGDTDYTDAAQRITQAINTHLWTGENYLLHVQDGVENPQVTGDSVFPLFTGIAEEEQFQKVKARLEQPDFWSKRGLRTLPNSDPQYDPVGSVGLLGGSWPNLTLWYAASIARHDSDRALAALEIVARPVVEEPEGMNVNGAEFPEYYHGDTGVNLGMKLSPFVAPTFVWAVMEGLLGLVWEEGAPNFAPNWPTGWQEVTVRNLPCGTGPVNTTLSRS
jgi:glycogen debranching enzyme